MAKYRKVDTRIWNDAKFQILSDDAKLIFFLLMTHPHSTSLGAFRSTIQALSADLGWQEERFRKAFRELTDKQMVEYSAKDLFIGLPNFLKYNRPESPNVVRSWRESVDLIPECALKDGLMARLKAFVEAFGEAFDKAFGEAFPEGYTATVPGVPGHPSPNHEHEHEHEQDKEKEASPKKTNNASIVPEKLQELINEWNQLPQGIAPRVKKLDSDAILHGWKRVHRVPEVSEAFEDVSVLIAKIRAGKFMHGKDWFRLTWLFGKGKDSKWNVLKVLAGNYEESKSASSGKQATGRHDPSNPVAATL